MTEAVGFLRYVFSGSKGVLGFLLARWQWSLTMFVVIILILHIFLLVRAQGTYEGVITTAITETAKSIFGADIVIYQTTDKLMTSGNNVFVTFTESQWWKPKLISLWEIIKNIATLFFSLLFVYYFIRLIVSIIKLIVGDSETGPAILLSIVFISLILIVANLIWIEKGDSITEQDYNNISTEGSTLESRFVPFRGIIHFVKTFVNVVTDPTYNLIKMDIPSYQPVFSVIQNTTLEDVMVVNETNL